LHLAQQATLETREAKHEPRSLAEQRATWLNEAATVLGGPDAVTSMVQTALAPHRETAPIADSHWVAQTADHILAVIEGSRSTWQMWHVRAEAQRQVRIVDVTAEHATGLVDLLVDEVLDRRSIALTAHDGVLAEQTGIRSDTLAKLTWSLDHGELPDWAAAVGPSTLVIIDEAGMADTLSLDTAVQFAIRRGANVRLLGDDQQLAPVGAGGVLRDITHSYGALQLTELHRFTDTAEAAASLALRDGKPEALDFYLDHGRVHVGDLATTTQDAFAAWVSDRAAGLDAIMLAPTRKLVAELNRQARDHLLGNHPPGREVRLADGNQASVGDVIITRGNDRRLRLTATDWVKNGDRWTITHVGEDGDLAVRHNRSHRTVQLPADYVSTSTGLGYASTIHAAQGVTADTMHGLITGQESRQQLYTMLTRGRAANHLYLQVVGDGDPHSLIRPDSVVPRTPTELLEQILARDDTPPSATTLLRRLSDPAARLHDAVQRYTDGLKVAAEQLVGPQIVHALDGIADQVIPELTSEPSWPTLRAHLLALAAETGEHPLLHLHEAALGRHLSTAGDMAAVLDWLLPAPTSMDLGPLPWLPGMPSTLHDHHVWGGYLAKRSQLVSGLADQVRDGASHRQDQPVWAPPGSHPTVALLGEVAVWRAANGVDPKDRRATGREQLQISSVEWQKHLERRIAHASDDPTNSGLRQEVGFRFEVRRDRDQHHRFRPSENSRRSGPPRLGL
jgi:hypothetical protein